MSEERRFSKESLIYVFGESLSKSLAFVLLPIYTAYLSLEDFAVLNLVTTLWPVIAVVLGQGFSTYIIRGYYDHLDKGRFFGTILSFSMVVGVVIAAGLHAVGPWLFDLIFKELQYRPFLQYAVFFAVFRLYITHVLSYYRAGRQAKTSVLLSFVLFSTILVAVILAIFVFDSGLMGILVAQLAAYVVVTAVYTVKIWSEVKFRPQLSLIMPGVLFVLPLIPHAFSGWLVNHVGKVFVETNMSLQDLSIYSVAVQLAIIIGVINNGLNQAWVPFVYANYRVDEARRLLSISAQRTILLVLLIAFVLVLFTKELLVLMSKPEYLAASYVLPILVLGYVFQIVYFTYVAVILYNRRPAILPVISISSGLLAVGLNPVLVPVLGMYGAAISTSGSFLLMAVLAYFLSQHYLKLRVINRRMLYFLGLVIFVTLLSLFYLNKLPLIPHLMVNLVLIALMIGVLIRLRLLNLKNIRELVQGILPFTFC